MALLTVLSDQKNQKVARDATNHPFPACVVRALVAGFLPNAMSLNASAKDLYVRSDVSSAAAVLLFPKGLPEHSHTAGVPAGAEYRNR